MFMIHFNIEFEMPNSDSIPPSDRKLNIDFIQTSCFKFHGNVT
jgi:hypothetical protein